MNLVPAVANVHDALVKLGLDEAVKVSTPIAFTALQESWPPSAGRFRDDIARSVMKPMLDFLERTGSYLTVNAYPFFAYAEEPDKISLDYALGNSNATGVRDPGTGLVYHSLLDAQLDATYFAMEKLGTSRSSAQEQNSMAQIYPSAYVSETGWASAGRLKTGAGRPKTGRAGVANAQAASVANAQAASVANAKAFNNYLINRVVSGDTGTPYRPDADMDVYIFALFNENQKGDGEEDIEQHFGLFYPNQTKVYEFDFRGGALASWCVAKPGVGDARLLEALNYACGNGADCSAIQPGGACFEPDTVVAHASYAFNSYYERKGRGSGTCDFTGTASVVYHAPNWKLRPPVECLDSRNNRKSEGYTAI
ncbi:glucan endo-1,3-beta-glucosidase 13-like [Miscanthus floridulus]|uniref:glucan endo-1,3-beta-glucosidase 13-like n=1 Tax=Miscanthus floridulus TaxID=154761 RepID=UPI00345997A7